MDGPTAELTPGHIIVLVSDLKRSIDFYKRVELPTFGEFPEDSIAIIELRGGAHVILAEKEAASLQGMPASRFGQQKEAFDLMIDSNAREDLEAYRARLIDNGIAGSDLNDELYFGHWFFSFEDPDGNAVTVYTSHEIKYWK